MKKKIIIPLMILSFILALCVVWFLPKTFGAGVSPEEVHSIRVFDGNTGRGFTINDPEDIRYILENLQSISMKKSGISLGHMGYALRITLADENDRNLMPTFIMNSADTIRKDPFFYRCEGGLCFEYIKGLEN